MVRNKKWGREQNFVFFYFNLKNKLMFLFCYFFYRAPAIDTKPDFKVVGKGNIPGFLLSFNIRNELTFLFVIFCRVLAMDTKLDFKVMEKEKEHFFFNLLI